MGYRLNRLDEPVFMAGPKPLRTEFGIHLRLESCDNECLFKIYFTISFLTTESFSRKFLFQVRDQGKFGVSTREVTGGYGNKFNGPNRGINEPGYGMDGNSNQPRVRSTF